MYDDESNSNPMMKVKSAPATNLRMRDKITDTHIHNQFIQKFLCNDHGNNKLKIMKSRHTKKRSF